MESHVDIVSSREAESPERPGDATLLHGARHEPTVDKGPSFFGSKGSLVGKVLVGFREDDEVRELRRELV